MYQSRHYLDDFDKLELLLPKGQMSVFYTRWIAWVSVLIYQFFMVKYKEVILEEFGRDHGTIKEQIIKIFRFS